MDIGGSQRHRRHTPNASLPSQRKARRASRTAPGPAAGYLFQLERALLHLSEGNDQTVVGIETLDDVAVTERGALRIREQDKLTFSSRAIGDRDAGFWKTLQIWLSEEHLRPSQYLFVAYGEIRSPFLSRFKESTARRKNPEKLVKDLRKIGAPVSTRKTKIQERINSVLAHGDARLSRILVRLQVIESSETNEQHLNKIGVRLGTLAGPERAIIVDQLLGWLQSEVLRAWREGRPAWISRSACIRQCRVIEARLQRRRILPLPSAQVSVSPAERTKALARNFVNHLSIIKAESDDIHEAVDHFIRFNSEKHRLAELGEIPVEEWESRADRLRGRWTQIARRNRRDFSDQPPTKIGLRTLADTTFDYHEPLDGQQCNELYMTSGHYHRLADDDDVWWHPEFRRPKRTT